MNELIHRAIWFGSPPLGSIYQDRGRVQSALGRVEGIRVMSVSGRGSRHDKEGKFSRTVKCRRDRGCMLDL
jgi:hypothetical protein